MPKNRLKLSDLYVVGKELTITEGDNSVTVWLQRLNPVDIDEAYKKGQAARSRVLTCKRDPESELYQATWMQVLDFGEDTEILIEYLLAPTRFNLQMTREAQLAAEDEWKEDEYLAGLQEAWASDLEHRSVTDPDDPEVIRVRNELTRFADQVEASIEAEVAHARAELENLSLDELRGKVHDSVLESAGNIAWLEAYKKAEVYLGTRDPDNHRERYFESWDEVDELSAIVYTKLSQAMEEMPRVDVLEGKGSGETPNSSTPSASQPATATVVPSGLAVVNR